jgi:hypothetical protein
VIRCVATENKLQRCSARNRAGKLLSGAAAAHLGGSWCFASDSGGRAVVVVVVEQQPATLGLQLTWLRLRARAAGALRMADCERFERLWDPADRWRCAADFTIKWKALARGVGGKVLRLGAAVDRDCAVS